MNSSKRFSDVQDHRRGQGTRFGMDAVLLRCTLSAFGPSRRSATQQNSVAIGGIADIGRFSASNDVQRLTPGQTHAAAG